MIKAVVLAAAIASITGDKAHEPSIAVPSVLARAYYCSPQSLSVKCVVIGDIHKAISIQTGLFASGSRCDELPVIYVDVKHLFITSAKIGSYWSVEKISKSNVLFRVILEKPAEDYGLHSKRGGNARVSYSYAKPGAAMVRDWLTVYGDNRHISANLSLSNLPRHLNSFSRCFVGVSGQEQSVNQQSSAEGDKKSRNPSGASHALSGVVHSLRSVSHALLGDKIILLTLIAFPFAALAGAGAFFAFDYSNGNTRLKRFGLLVALLFSGLSAICLVLGLQ